MRPQVTVYRIQRRGHRRAGKQGVYLFNPEVADYFKIDISDMSGGTATPMRCSKILITWLPGTLEMFYYVAIDEDSQLIMSLSENGGYKGSKAAKLNIHG